MDNSFLLFAVKPSSFTFFIANMQWGRYSVNNAEDNLPATELTHFL
jgi:hypothetical protein